MTDVFSKTKRSQIMRSIGPKDSGLRNMFDHWFTAWIQISAACKGPTRQSGYRPATTPKSHFCARLLLAWPQGLPPASLPSTNRAFWKNKIAGNMRRDSNNYRKLRKLGWSYLVIWQCGIKKRTGIEVRSKLSKFLPRHRNTNTAK